MLKAISRYAFMILASLAFLGLGSTTNYDAAYAASTQVIENVENEALPAGATIEQVETAVLSALTGRGWTLSARAPGSVDAQYARRGFTVTIRVTYTAQTYSIAYVESSGLNYDPETQRIHGNYNRWVRNLQVDIPRLVQNAVLGAPPPQ